MPERTATITVWPTTARVVSQSHSACWDLRRHLRYADPAAPGGWCYCISKEGHLLPGLASRSRNLLRAWGYRVEIIDETGEPKLKPGNVTVPLRDYQQPAVEKMAKVKRGILQAPMGAGKTVIAAALLQKLPNHRPCIFLVERKDLLRQAQADLSTWLGSSVGMIGDGKRILGEDGITVCTVQTISGRIDQFPELAETHWVIADETHHCASPTYQRLLLGDLKHLWRVTGLSGTPWRDDGTTILLEGVVGPVEHVIRAEALVEQGYLTKPLCVFQQLPPSGYRGTCTWQEQYDRAIVSNKVRNDCITSFAEWMYRQGRSCLILVERIAHGEMLADALGCPFTQGGSSGADRHDTLQRLRKQTELLTVSTVFREAVDIPALDGVVIAGAGKSSVRFYQSWRNTRIFEGKRVALILDFLDRGKWIGKHARRRLALCEERDEVEVVIRDDWLDLHPPPISSWDRLRKKMR